MKLNAIVCVGFGPGIRSGLVLVCWLSADFSLGTEGGELAEFLFAFGRGSSINIKIASYIYTHRVYKVEKASSLYWYRDTNITRPLKVGVSRCPRD